MFDADTDSQEKKEPMADASGSKCIKTPLGVPRFQRGTLQIRSEPVTSHWTGDRSYQDATRQMAFSIHMMETG